MLGDDNFDFSILNLKQGIVVFRIFRGKGSVERQASNISITRLEIAREKRTETRIG